MKYLITLFLLTASWMFRDPAVECNPSSFNFSDSNWQFPSTVEEAVTIHRLDYSPPGYYHKTDSTRLNVLVDYRYQPLDFDNENQPKETLFPRELEAYIFQFKEKPGIYDSLVTNLESTYSKKFVLTKGLKTAHFLLQEHERPFEYNLLRVNECLVIGLKHSSSEALGKIVTVQFMYGLSLGDIGIQMGNF